MEVDGQCFIGVDDFCAKQVDPMWREADEIQVQALARYFEVPIHIHYLDNTAGGSAGGAVSQCTCHSFVDFSGGNEKAAGGGAKDVAIDFLYRPGHYELLYR